MGAGDGRVVRHPTLQSRQPDQPGIGDHTLARLGGIDHQHHLAVFDHVDDMRSPFLDLVDHAHRNPLHLQHCRGATSGDQTEAQFGQRARDFNHFPLVGITHGQEHRSGLRQDHAGRQLALDEGLAEAHANPHHFAGGFHFRPENRVDTRKLGERKHRLLDAEVWRTHLSTDALLVQTDAGHHSGGDFGQRQSACFRDEGHGTRGARIDLQHVHQLAPVLLLDRELNVHQSDHAKRARHRGGLHAQFILQCVRQRVGRQRACRISGMDTGLLDMLHDAADEHPLAVSDAIDIDLDGIVQEAVKQDRRIVRYLDRLTHVALEIALFVDNLHGAPAQHIARAHHQGVADFPGQLDRGRFGSRGTVRRLPQLEFVQQFLEALAVLGHIDRFRRGADNRHPIGLKRARQLQRCLTTELHDHAFRLLDRHDLEHILERQGLEIQAVGGIVIG